MSHETASLKFIRLNATTNGKDKIYRYYSDKFLNILLNI